MVPRGRWLGVGKMFVVPGEEVKEGRAFGGIYKALGFVFSFSFFF